VLAAWLADFLFRADARNGPSKWIFYFADSAQKLINFADLLKLAVSPSSGVVMMQVLCWKKTWVLRIWCSRNAQTRPSMQAKSTSMIAVLVAHLIHTVMWSTSSHMHHRITPLSQVIPAEGEAQP
jgi:hypothetical protein